MKIHFLKINPSFVRGFLFLVFGLCCSASLAQVLKKNDLTIIDREEWRNVLKWPDECERGFREYQQYSPPGGLEFNRLGENEYLVMVGCSANSSIFMYYRENSNLPARLLSFIEYDRAYRIKNSSYSRVNFLAISFNPEGNQLWIYSRTSTENVCLIHKYTFRRGQPILIRKQKKRCSDIV